MNTNKNISQINIPHDTIGCLVPHNIQLPIHGKQGGPLEGKTFIVKDLYNIEGRKTGNGSPDFYANTEPATETAVTVQKLLDSGANLVGISICDEFFYSLTGINAHYGTPQNLNAPGRLPGGSSSGSAAALTAKLCDFTLGSDTGGSVRIPASFCGLYGIRPTHGRVDLSGGRAMAPSFDTAGWFCNDPSLFKTLGSILLDNKSAYSHTEQLMLAIDCFKKADPEVSKALRKTIEAVSSIFPSISEVTVAPDGLDHWSEAFRIIQASEVKETNLPWVQKNEPDLGPGIKERFAMAANITLRESETAKKTRKNIRNHLNELFRPGKILCLPTSPVIAPKTDTTPDGLEFFRSNALALTCISGLSGFPQVSIPATSVENCPVGLSFIGGPGTDELLLDLALQLSPFCT